MKKVISAISMVILILFCTGMINNDLLAKPKFTIAVLDFKVSTGSTGFSYLKVAIPEMFATNLAQVPELTILERDRVKKILRENKLVLTGITKGNLTNSADQSSSGARR